MEMVNFFLHTKSCIIHYWITKAVSNRSKSTMLPIINQIIKLYSNRGFKINEVLGNNEFDCISNDISPIQINVVACDAHASDAENAAKVIKQYICCIINAPPYPSVPKLAVTATKEIANENINDIQASKAILCTISLATITSRPPTNIAHLRLDFGDYVHLTNKQLPYNSH